MNLAANIEVIHVYVLAYPGKSFLIDFCFRTRESSHFCIVSAFFLGSLIKCVFTIVSLPLTSSEFKGHAGTGPDVSWRTIAGSKQDLQGAILTSLDVLGEVVLLPASVAQVRNLHL